MVAEASPLSPVPYGLFSYFPAMLASPPHLWLHHLQDEADAAYLYLALAGQETDPHKKDVYVKLAGVEERHVQMWEKLLADHGHRTGPARPSTNARLRAWFGRRFGTRYLLPLLGTPWHPGRAFAPGRQATAV